MNAKKVFGVILLVLGIAALAQRGFTYTKETHDAKLGPLEFSVKEKDRVEIPIWLGVTVAAAGGVLLLLPSRKS